MLRHLVAFLASRAWRRQDSSVAPGRLRARVGALIEADACDEALALAAEASASAPDSYEAKLCLGLANQKLHRPERALACYAEARTLRGEDADLHDLRGSALQELGRLDEAIAEFDRALALQPDHRLAAFHRALALLLAQDFAHGWEGYELRRLNHPPRPPGPPEWDGAPLAGRNILLYREQGLGDEIMFASMVPELTRMAGHCTIECDPRLCGLFRRSFPAATVFGALPGGGIPDAVSRQRIDVACPAGSLPRFLRRAASEFPPTRGYLIPDAERVAYWRHRLESLGPGMKVGISWTGGVRKTRRAVRSLELDRWLPILRTAGVRFVSLQYTPHADREAADAQDRHGIRLTHWAEPLNDYDETAALTCALDLMISVCTSAVHLGGALGRPVWVMAPYSPEWRYGFRGDAMPWYPSVRIFRQPFYGGWAPVVDAVAGELRRTTRSGT